MPSKEIPPESDVCLVIENWKVFRTDPIQVLAGEIIVVSGHENILNFRKWIWAKSKDGKEGWILDCIVSTDADKKS